MSIGASADPPLTWWQYAPYAARHRSQLLSHISQPTHSHSNFMTPELTTQLFQRHFAVAILPACTMGGKETTVRKKTSAVNRKFGGHERYLSPR